MNGFDFFIQPIPMDKAEPVTEDNQPIIHPDWNDWMEIDYQNSKEDINNEHNA